jgi:hypothetical protein
LRNDLQIQLLKRGCSDAILAIRGRGDAITGQDALGLFPATDLEVRRLGVVAVRVVDVVDAWVGVGGYINPYMNHFSPLSTR